MGPSQNDPLRVLEQQEQQELQRVVKATSERVDVVKRATILLAVAAGRSWSEAGRQAGLSRQAVGKVVKRFNARGLAALEIAPGRGRKVTYTSAQRARMLAEVQRVPDRKADGTASWSLSTLQRALRKAGLPRVGATTIRRVLHAAGYAFGKTRTWCPTGTALRKRKAGIVTVHDPAPQEKTRLIEQAYEQAEAAGVELWNEDEAGPYQAIPQAGEDWHPQGKPRLLPHEYQRGGTAKLLTLFRPATGLVRAKGVLSAPNAVLHPWLKEQVLQELAQIEKAHPSETLPPTSFVWNGKRRQRRVRARLRRLGGSGAAVLASNLIAA